MADDLKRVLAEIAELRQEIAGLPGDQWYRDYVLTNLSSRLQRLRWPDDERAERLEGALRELREASKAFQYAQNSRESVRAAWSRKVAAAKRADELLADFDGGVGGEEVG